MKLVRDDYEQGNGFTLRPVESRKEHIALLRDKINEELKELFDEDFASGGSIEAGDVIEAVLAYCKVRWDLSEERVFDAKDKKAERLGGFDKGIVWVEG